MALIVMLAACGLPGRPGTEPEARVPAAVPEVTSPASACTSPQSGPLRQDTAFITADGVEVNYSISVPDGYYDDCKTYPVVYVLHGKLDNNASFMDDALTLRRAVSEGALTESIIVTPDSYQTGRWEDLDTGPAEDNFINHLIPHIESSYRVTQGPAQRLLVGFSMGGHGAIRFALKYPKMFAATWSVDGAMARDSNAYMPFVDGRKTADFHVISVAGPTNGERVETLIEDLRNVGIDIPYTYQDVPHDFGSFVEADRIAGWPAMSFLQRSLGRIP
ncbi:esterase family protein [Mycobacterium sp. 141]|uniref:alpha/beta hydrolase n=1 Tax=Mycobacterium sp. 141 TaxID=1120797 RepID=UPI000380FA27|nr:alpha/beta hydrolase-fold protein [Mycobacterium sp. 141]